MDFDVNSFLLNRGISDEIARKDYIFNDEDYELLQSMLKEINALGYKFKYLAELDEYNIPNIGDIVKKYIYDFSSQATRAYLISKMVFDKVTDCDKIILDLYYNFKNSDSYISKPGEPVPAHIYVRYDNAFLKLKPKKIKSELIKLAHNPRDAFYLPLTMRMLASWKNNEVKDLLLLYLNSDNITIQMVGGAKREEECTPDLSFIKRELKFLAIDGLKYYPTDEIFSLIKQYEFDDDSDIRMAVGKSLKRMEKSRQAKK